MTLEVGSPGVCGRQAPGPRSSPGASCLAPQRRFQRPERQVHAGTRTRWLPSRGVLGGRRAEGEQTWAVSLRDDGEGSQPRVSGGKAPCPSFVLLRPPAIGQGPPTAGRALGFPPSLAHALLSPRHAHMDPGPGAPGSACFPISPSPGSRTPFPSGSGSAFPGRYFPHWPLERGREGGEREGREKHGCERETPIACCPPVP